MRNLFVEIIEKLKNKINKTTEPVVLESHFNSEGDEIVTTKDSEGNIYEIRYNKSFTAKLSQASDEVKDYYNKIKNHALSYKALNSKISWNYDSINIGIKQLMRFMIRGKTLCVYYALDEVDYKYKVERTDTKKFDCVPILYRIKNDRRCDYAKELVDILMRKFHVKARRESNEDFTLPYEETRILLERGLIKETQTKLGKVIVGPRDAISIAKLD